MKRLIFLAAVIFLFIFTALPVTAAPPGSRQPVSVYIPSGTSLTTERIVYNAITAAGGICVTEERFSGADSFDAMMGRGNAVAAGISEYTKTEHGDEITKVNIPIGKVEYIAYAREADGISVASWEDTEGYRTGAVVDSNYVMSRLDGCVTAPDFQGCFDDLLNGVTDVFVATVYDGVTPSIPEGIVKAGAADGSDTFCWYNSDQPEIGEMLARGLETIEANGVYDRIMNRQSTDANNSKVVFQLSSYSNEMIWESQAEQTLRETLAQSPVPVSLHIHNMNFRRTNYRSALYEAATNYARATFMTEYPDVIIAMDNDALAYLQENYRRLFYGVPVVFCGISSFNESLISEFSQFATGISEYIDPTETVEFALAHNPDIDRIYTVVDETSSASPVKEPLMKMLEDKYGGSMEVTSSGDQTFEEILDEVKGLDRDTMVLIGTYFSDKNGRFMPESEVASRLSQAANVPVYCLTSGYLGYGVVGGRVADSKTFTEEAANMALRILEGKDPSDIPIIENIENEALFNKFIVDKHAADRFGIGENLYAGKAIVLNEDVTVFEAYPVHATIAVSIIVILSVTSVLFLLLMRTKRLRDIALLQAEHEKANNRMKSDFLARMSHEIRTPLNAIIGMDELILQEDISKSVHQNALIILHSGRSLLSIINDILDFSKIEAGKMELIMTDFDVGSLIYDTVSMIRVRVSDKPIEVKMDISPEFPAYLYGDETRVRQVLLNFLTNSAKYTNEGVITLKADFEFDSEAKTGGTAVFTITDTGIGIKKEDIEKLFDAFSQVDTKTNRKVEGTGLGLAITKTLVEMMKGYIEVNSEYGKGSEFVVHMRHEVNGYKPLADASEAFRKKLEEEGKRKYVRFTAPSARILAVDDVAANLMVVTGLLSPYKIKVDTAINGMAAVDAVMKTDYDFIFMDHMMPDMDGIETTQKIRGLDGDKYRKIPVIALTANAISGMKDMFLKKGFNDFISKPIELDELDRILHHWIPKAKRLNNDGGENETEAVIERGLLGIKGIDIAKGLKLFGGKAKNFERVLLLFAKDLNKNIGSLMGLLEAENYEELHQSLHSIKGMSGNLSCTEVYELSRNLDNAVRKGDYEFVKEYLPDLILKAKEVAASIEKNLG